MAEITHGISTGRRQTSVSNPVVAASGIHFVVGTAPVQMSEEGKTNAVVMAQNYAEAVRQMGYSDDWAKYSLCEEVFSAFMLYKTAPVFMVNVLDPEKHKKDVVKESVKPEDNKILLPGETIAETVKIEGMEMGTDFDAFYTDSNCVLEFLADTMQTEDVSVSYSAVAPELVTKEDIIGGYDVIAKKAAGLELIDSVFPKYGYVPDIIICPGWSHDPEVAAVMAAKAENINGVFEAVAILDVDVSKENGAACYSDVPEWKKQKNFTKPTEIVCFPKVALGDRVFHLSTQLAGSMAATDNNEDLGDGTPCESASNKSLQADRMVDAEGNEILLDIQQANYLNENGIVTGLNFYNGFVSWGIYTACYPSSTDVADYMYNINRMFRWVSKNIILSYWSYIDKRMTRVLIDAILEGINSWLNGLSAEGKILGGSVVMEESENPTTALMAGRVKYHVYLTPPSSMKKMEFVLEYDLSYLESALAA